MGIIRDAAQQPFSLDLTPRSQHGHVYDEMAEYTSASICHNDPNFCDLPGCSSCRPETYRGAHRGHSHEYRGVYDNLGQSRAKCLEGLTTLCDRGMCPKHDATAYANHMARHATDSI